MGDVVICLLMQNSWRSDFAEQRQLGKVFQLRSAGLEDHRLCSRTDTYWVSAFTNDSMNLAQKTN